MYDLLCFVELNFEAAAPSQVAHTAKTATVLESAGLLVASFRCPCPATTAVRTLLHSCIPGTAVESQLPPPTCCWRKMELPILDENIRLVSSI